MMLFYPQNRNKYKKVSLVTKPDRIESESTKPNIRKDLQTGKES